MQNGEQRIRLMCAHRFELSEEAFHFYGSAEVLQERQEFYGSATFLLNSDGLYHGRSSELFPQNSYISKQRSQIYKERLQNSKEICLILKITVIFLQNDTTFSSRSVCPSGPPHLKLWCTRKRRSGGNGENKRE